MAAYSYYYMISVIAVLTAALAGLNLILLRRFGKTTFGVGCVPGSEQHRRLRPIFNNKVLSILLVITIALVLNLVNSVKLIINLHRADTVALLITLPLLFIFIGLVVLLRLRGKFQ